MLAPIIFLNNLACKRSNLICNCLCTKYICIFSNCGVRETLRPALKRTTLNVLSNKVTIGMSRCELLRAAH